MKINYKIKETVSIIEDTFSEQEKLNCTIVFNILKLSSLNILLEKIKVNEEDKKFFRHQYMNLQNKLCIWVYIDKSAAYESLDYYHIVAEEEKLKLVVI